jgi:RNA polymerase sigma-70 factor (ECF subfamily)
LRTVGNPQQAEDAAQEAFFAAYRSLRTFRGGAFRGWLLRIAVNQCYDQLRLQRRRPAGELAEDVQLADPDPQPEQMALTAETIAVLEGAIHRLPPDQRMCVVLIDVQGLGYEEAAVALKINIGTLKSRLSRARAQLRELLAPEFRLRSGG